MFKRNKKVKPFIEFNITEKCNYFCEYCSQGHLNKNEPEKLQNAPDEVIEGFVDLIKKEKRDYVVQLIGGEPFCHPKFFEVAKKIVDLGNEIIVVTNMSFPAQSFKRLAEVAGNKLIRIHGSIHLAQIKDVGAYVDKLIQIKSLLPLNTEYRIMSIILDDNFELLNSIKEKLESNGVEFIMARLIEKGKPRNYSSEIEDFLKKQNKSYEKNIVTSTSINTKNIMCHAGCEVFHVSSSGRIDRCWSFQKEHQSFGNVAEPASINLLNKAMPCYAKKCNCSYPTERNAYYYSRLAPLYRIDLKKFIKKLLLFISCYR